MLSVSLDEGIALPLQFHLCGHADLAKFYYDLILKQRPELEFVHIFSHQLPRHTGWDEAAIIADFTTHLPQHPDVLVVFALALAAIGYPDQARTALAQAQRQSPEHPRVLRAYQLLAWNPALAPFPLAPAPTLTASPPVAAGAHLVLGTAVGYPVAALRPYVLSLRAVYDGEAALLVQDSDPAVLDFLAAHRITPLRYDPARWPDIHIQTSRYLFYAEALEAWSTRRGQEFAAIFLCDVRDLVFQADPFRHDLAGEVFWFLEEDGSTLGTCPNNGTWIRNCFGRAVHAALHACPISCSGTTLGTGPAIRRYLRQMITLLNTLPLLTLHIAGHDQALHNGIAHLGLVSGGCFVPNHRHVATIHHTRLDDLQIGSDGRVAHAASGHICPILHQYDRHPALVRQVRGLYAS